MKAELTKDGTLRITPQTECEAYALRAWQAARGQRDKAKRPALEVLTEPETSGWVYGGTYGTLTGITGINVAPATPTITQSWPAMDERYPLERDAAGLPTRSITPTTTQPWENTFPDTGGVVCP